MSDSPRHHFLKNWHRYPGYTEGVGVRIKDLTSEKMTLRMGKEEIVIQGVGKVPVELKPGDFWKSLSMEEFNQVFAPGDWLIIGVDGELSQISDLNSIQFCRLAAPNLTSKSPQPKSKANDFFRFIEDVRQFFIECRFTPATTPSLVVCPGMEPPLVPFEVLTETEKPHFLPTSPELHLKKLLCRGYENIFEIKRVYRREISTSHHQPEFLMLEWYRSFATLDSIEQDLKELLIYLESKGWGDESLEIQWRSTTMQELFQEFLGFDLTPQTEHGELIALARQKEVGFHTPDDSWDDTFFKIFLTCIEPKLHQWPSLTLRGYPPSQAALARLNQQGWAERMEFYLHGIEVGNAFDELTDPKLQRLRFEHDQQERRDRDLVDVPIDEEFLQSLEMGMPPTAGFAVGLERLFMGLTGQNEITELLEFPKEF